MTLNVTETIATGSAKIVRIIVIVPIFLLPWQRIGAVS